MDTNTGNKLLLKDEVYQVVGSAIEVLNGIGHGWHEKPYENALVIEFGIRNIPTRQRTSFDVLYKGSRVGLLVPDLIACDQVIVDAKVIEGITNVERGQVLNYLRITKISGGRGSEFQEPEIGMGAYCSWKFVSISG